MSIRACYNCQNFKRSTARVRNAKTKHRCHIVGLPWTHTTANDACAKHTFKSPLRQRDCPTCDGGGWVQKYSPNPPSFAVCPGCYNVAGFPCP